MSAYSVRQVVQSLHRKGFVEERGDHQYLRLVVDGKATPVMTFVSRGKGFDVGGGLLAMMARQLRLTGAEFRWLVECPLTHDAYVRLLRDRGVL
jgi:hypothetical protein